LSQPPSQAVQTADEKRTASKGQELHIRAKSQIHKEMRNELLGNGENITFTFQGLTLEKKPWGQLAPKFIDLVASTNFLVAKRFLLENFI